MAKFELRACRKPDHHTPEVTLATKEVPLTRGLAQRVTFDFGVSVDDVRYVWVCALANDALDVHTSVDVLTGFLAVHHHYTQKPDTDIGVETLEIWPPVRRPGPQNLAMRFDPPLASFGPEHLTNGLQRPTRHPNAWIADPADPVPTVTLQWTTPVTLGRVVITFDADYDHPMESVLYGHPERHMPQCVRHFRLRDAEGAILFEDPANHHDRRESTLPHPVTTRTLTLECLATWGRCPPSVFELRAYRR